MRRGQAAHPAQQDPLQRVRVGGQRELLRGGTVGQCLVDRIPDRTGRLLDKLGKVGVVPFA